MALMAAASMEAVVSTAADTGRLHPYSISDGRQCTLPAVLLFALTAVGRSNAMP